MSEGTLALTVDEAWRIRAKKFVAEFDAYLNDPECLGIFALVFVKKGEMIACRVAGAADGRLPPETAIKAISDLPEALGLHKVELKPN